MICSVHKDRMLIKASNGDKFYVQLGLQPVEVPRRDGTGEYKTTMFDMTMLMLKGCVRDGTSADTAAGALKLLGTYPECPEINMACRIIKRFLDSQRERRRDETILTMAALYGQHNTLKISEGIRNHQFDFPVWYLKETGFAKAVNTLITEYPGTASAMAFAPWQFSQLQRACAIFGGSVCSHKMKVLFETLHLDESRIKPVFEVAKFLEVTR